MGRPARRGGSTCRGSRRSPPAGRWRRSRKESRRSTRLMTVMSWNEVTTRSASRVAPGNSRARTRDQRSWSLPLERKRMVASGSVFARVGPARRAARPGRAAGRHHRAARSGPTTASELRPTISAGLPKPIRRAAAAFAYRSVPDRSRTVTPSAMLSKISGRRRVTSSSTPTAREVDSASATFAERLRLLVQPWPGRRASAAMTPRRSRPPRGRSESGRPPPPPARRAIDRRHAAGGSAPSHPCRACAGPGRRRRAPSRSPGDAAPRPRRLRSARRARSHAALRHRSHGAPGRPRRPGPGGFRPRVLRRTSTAARQRTAVHCGTRRDVHVACRVRE